MALTHLERFIDYRCEPRIRESSSSTWIMTDEPLYSIRRNSKASARSTVTWKNREEIAIRRARQSLIMRPTSRVRGFIFDLLTRSAVKLNEISHSFLRSNEFHASSYFLRRTRTRDRQLLPAFFPSLFIFKIDFQTRRNMSIVSRLGYQKYLRLISRVE